MHARAQEEEAQEDCSSGECRRNQAGVWTQGWWRKLPVVHNHQTYHQALASVQLREKQIRLQDVQSLLLWILGEGSNPRWAFVQVPHTNTLCYLPVPRRPLRTNPCCARWCCSWHMEWVPARCSSTPIPCSSSAAYAKTQWSASTQTPAPLPVWSRPPFGVSNKRPRVSYTRASSTQAW